MSVIRRIAKNTAALFASQAIIQLLGVLLAIVIARKLGEVQFGEYSFAIAFASILVMMFAEMGYQTLLIREVAKNHDDATRYLNNVLGVRIILTIATLGLIIIIINLMGYPQHLKEIVYIFSAATLISSLSGVFLVTFRAFQRMEYEAIATMAEGAVRVGLGLIVLFLGYGLMELGIAFVVSSLVGFFISAEICHRRFVPAKIRFDPAFFKSTIWIAIPLAILPMLAIMYIRADTILLSVMKGEAMVGWYNAAYNIVLTLKMVPILLMTSLFPAAVKVSVSSRQLYSYYYEKAIKNLIALGIPMVIGLAVLAEPVILIMYGPNFANSIEVLKILALDCLLMFIYQPLANALIGYGKERQVAISAGLCLALNVALNIWLIPRYGMLGAAWATIGSEVILLVANLRFYQRSIGDLKLGKYFVKPIIASVPMLALLEFLNINILVLVPLGIAVYFLSYILLGGLDAQEEQTLRHALSAISGRLKKAKTKS